MLKKENSEEIYRKVYQAYNEKSNSQINELKTILKNNQLSITDPLIKKKKSEEDRNSIKNGEIKKENKIFKLDQDTIKKVFSF
jgi:hypothetical protein